jgi:hypothetical protein
MSDFSSTTNRILCVGVGLVALAVAALQCSKAETDNSPWQGATADDVLLYTDCENSLPPTYSE